MAHPNSKKSRAAKERRAAERRQRTGSDRETVTDQQRVAQRAEVLARRRREERRQVWTIRAIAFVVFVGALVGLAVALQPDPELAGVTRPRDDGRGHTESATFGSATPTSGAHTLSYSTACGVQSTEMDASLAVHALEHGVVLIWYAADRPDLATDLAVMARKWPSHVIVSPNPKLSSPVVATAWNRLKTYDSANPEIEDFIRIYRNRGPEDIECSL